MMGNTFRYISVIWIGCCCFCSWMEQGHATIRIVSSGRRFASKGDKSLGPRLKGGEEYRARLQYIEANPHLCAMSLSDSLGEESGSTVPQMTNITVPSDGSAGVYM